MLATPMTPGGSTHRQCAACGASAGYGSPPTSAAETVAYWRCGLDGRPGFEVSADPGSDRTVADATLLAHAYPIEECPHCGHLAPNVAVPYPELATARDARQGMLALADHHPVALRFLAVSQLFGDHDVREQGWWVLRAAWADEAAGFAENARHLRVRGASLLEEATLQGYALFPARGATSLALCEMFRVGGNRVRALEHGRRALAAVASGSDVELFVTFEALCMAERKSEPFTRGHAREVVGWLGAERALELRKTLESDHPLPAIRVKAPRAFHHPMLPLNASRREEAIVFAQDFASPELLLDLLRDGRLGVWEMVLARPRMIAPLFRAADHEQPLVRQRALTILAGKALSEWRVHAQGTAGDPCRLAEFPDAIEALARRLDDSDGERVGTAAEILRQALEAEPELAPHVVPVARAALAKWSDTPATGETLEQLIAVAPREPEVALPSPEEVDAVSDWAGFERAASALSGSEAWKELDRLLRRAIHALVGHAGDTIAGRKKGDRECELWLRLGALYRDKLGNRESAIMAYQMAAVHHPGDATIHEALAKLRAAEGQIEPAIRDNEIAVRLEPSEIGSYSRLFDIHREQGNTDAAWCVAAAIASIATSDAAPGAVEAQRFYERHLARQVPPLAYHLGETDWLVLRHEDESDMVTSVFRAVAGALERLRIRGDRPSRTWAFESPATRCKAFPAVFAHAALALGLPTRVHVSLGTTESPDLPPGSALDATFDGFTLAELLFVAGYHAAYHRPALKGVFAAAGESEVSEVFMASARVGWRDAWGHPPPADDGTMALASQLARALDPADRSFLGRCVDLVRRQGSVDLKSWRRGVERTALRAGLLLAGDPIHARRLLTSERDRSLSVLLTTQERLEEVSAFAVSDSYVKLRKLLGWSIEASSSTGESAPSDGEFGLVQQLCGLFAQLTIERLPNAAALAEYLRPRASKFAVAGPNLQGPEWARVIGGAEDVFVTLAGPEVIGIHLSDDSRGWGVHVEIAVRDAALAVLEPAMRGWGGFRSRPGPDGVQIMNFDVRGTHVDMFVHHAGGRVKRVQLHLMRFAEP
jgi:tetratricopeptide (TPR) repeat protein